MVIFETSIFTKKITALLNDEEYRTLQNVLVEMPGSGDIIQGSGGIRKIRWGASGRGKRGGARVIYYWATQHDQIFMLYAYAKNERDDLTKEQLSVIREVVASEFKNEK
ncbi:type II toxin-antitoxin system RelE/ParE family toxin [Methyloglobulus sp.]|uniref:type II toxin-antitoxin system RelE/ParE family toxin n=1 Tax=Methyloglobulus sp. TaxID=2518622 RepID=UPI003989121B